MASVEETRSALDWLEASVEEVSDFKRDVYHEIDRSMRKSLVTFVLGPRKCGKTYAVLQLHKEYRAASEYHDFKASKDCSVDYVNKIVDDIKHGIPKIYFLDEITYADFPESEIARIALAYDEAEVSGVMPCTRVVITGSQSVALSSWAHRAFAGDAAFVRTSFLTYSEWLRWKNRSDVTEQSYNEFICGTKEFYKKFGTVEQYLKGCLEETAISNASTNHMVYGNAVDKVDEKTLLDILYLTLFSTHNNIHASNLRQGGAFSKYINYLCKQLNLDEIAAEKVQERLSLAYVEKYDHVVTTDFKILKRSLLFLMQCGLVTATVVLSDFNSNVVDVKKQLDSIDCIYSDTNDLLSNVNFTINYPMFYVDVINEVLGFNVTEVARVFLGSVVECHARGLLPSYGCCEYHSCDEREDEIDYVNLRERSAVEFTVSNKKISKVHLDLIPQDEFQKFLLTKDITEMREDVALIPYYQFIYDLSDGVSLDCIYEECKRQTMLSRV